MHTGGIRHKTRLLLRVLQRFHNDSVFSDDVERLHAVLIAAQHYIYSSRQLFKLAQDAFKRAVPPVNSATSRCQKLLDAALELGLQVRILRTTTKNFATQVTVFVCVCVANAYNTASAVFIRRSESGFFSVHFCD
jgi:dolichyl-phosphate-mannose--protein O-mannosyl transferase